MNKYTYIYKFDIVDMQCRSNHVYALDVYSYMYTRRWKGNYSCKQYLNELFFFNFTGKAFKNKCI